MEAYAEAGIWVFIRVELDTASGLPEIAVHKLVGGRYQVSGVARGREPSTVAVPFPLMITSADLTGPAASAE